LDVLNCTPFSSERELLFGWLDAEGTRRATRAHYYWSDRSNVSGSLETKSRSSSSSPLGGKPCPCSPMNPSCSGQADSRLLVGQQTPSTTTNSTVPGAPAYIALPFERSAVRGHELNPSGRPPSNCRSLRKGTAKGSDRVDLLLFAPCEVRDASLVFYDCQGKVARIEALTTDWQGCVLSR